MIKKMITVILGMILCLSVGSNVLADPIEMTGIVAGGPVDVFANFIIGTDTLTVQVWNGTVNPKDVAQNITDLFFALSTGQTTGTLDSRLGLERTISKNDGTFSDGSEVNTGWGLNNDYTFGFETGLRLYVLGTDIGPAHSIVGLPDGSGVYSNANGSIAGNKPHNPFLFGTESEPVTFTLLIPGVTEDTHVSDVAFSFGTTGGDWLTHNQVPEPTTLLLLGFGLIGVAGISRKLKK